MPVTGVIQDAIFRPGVRDIAAITNAYIATVTTTSDHNYVNGLWVRLYIPHDYGMTQANRLKGIIEVTGSTTFTITIDTFSFDAFVVPSFDPLITPTPAQCVPIGEENDTLLGSFRNVIMPLY